MVEIAFRKPGKGWKKKLVDNHQLEKVLQKLIDKNCEYRYRVL